MASSVSEVPAVTDREKQVVVAEGLPVEFIAGAVIANFKVKPNLVQVPVIRSDQEPDFILRTPVG